MTITSDRSVTADRSDLTIGTRPVVTVLVDRCAGCQECVVRCPTQALDMDIARWVAVADQSRCVGCRQCVRTCPFSAITVDGPQLVASRIATTVAAPVPLVGDTSETRQGIASFDEAVAEASRCLACPDPTCVRGCPTHNDIPAFVAAVAERDLDRAHQILRRTTILPDICSRVCDQAVQCEGACTWSLAGATPVAIGALERFIADHQPVPPPTTPTPTAAAAGTAAAGTAAAGTAAADGAAGRRPRRVVSRQRELQPETTSVAIVGSGPAAMGAAWELIEGGAAVTVYERDPTPGGLLGWGIPDFTLPAAVAGRPWDQLQDAGVELHCSTPVDADMLQGLLADHDAVILAHGAGLPLRPPIPGVDLAGVEDATSFLQRARTALANQTSLDDLRRADGTPATVLVLGAGNTAMDVARCARRLDTNPICIDWMDPRFAPVRPDELDEARHEGVEVRFTSTVVELVGTDGTVSAARIAATRQDRATERPHIEKNSAELVPVDHVVLAMGYRLDPELSTGDLATTVSKQVDGLPDRQWTASGILAVSNPPYARRQPVGRLALGREKARTTAALPRRPRLWVAGDALTGPATVVEAMAQGREAARAILAHRPHRPQRPGTHHPHISHVVVGYDSVGGRTKACAWAIANQLTDTTTTVEVLPLARIDTKALARADLLIIGTWTEGKIIAAVGPARSTRRWLAALPPIAGLPVATFCTYSIDPRTTLSQLRHAIETAGGHIIADAAFRGRTATNTATNFAVTLHMKLATHQPQAS